MLRPGCLAKSLYRSPEIFVAQFLLHSPFLQRQCIAAIMIEALRSTYLCHRLPLFLMSFVLFAFFTSRILRSASANPPFVTQNSDDRNRSSSNDNSIFRRHRFDESLGWRCGAIFSAKMRLRIMKTMGIWKKE
ncbi:hypothetical protein L6452_36198 [Arctium lappa]|uniref:Uncharacterized protein n=1 Tax=Arctium lappa TaxID=4217 RepID=A0ACB8Y9V3_ARCLA|nr:hypothetical protein L6452_36198 [Arctium lappa]